MKMSYNRIWCRRIVKNCWPSTASRPNTGRARARAIPSNRPFGAIRHRTKRAKGCLSRDGMLHMMFKLGMCAEQNWRKLRGFDYLAKVIEGVQFRDGIEVKESETKEQVAA